MSRESLIELAGIVLVGYYKLVEASGSFRLERLDQNPQVSDLEQWVFSSEDEAIIISFVFSLAFNEGTSKGSIGFRRPDNFWAVEISGGELGSCAFFKIDENNASEKEPFLVARSQQELEEALPFLLKGEN